MNASSRPGLATHALRPALTIRTKLALVTLVLLVIPWVGYKYVKTMEHLLRENQVQAVVATARAVAAALQDRPRLLEMHAPAAADATAAMPRPVSEEIQLLMTGLAREGERERFNARAVLVGCISGYAGIYPHRCFELAADEAPVMLNGAPDLFAQMLDKLAANAVDFSSGDDAVRISLEQNDGDAVLMVTNSGPLLPAEMQGRLFESMISMRTTSHAGEPHLGLGLYIVRMIAEFHGGHVSADNRSDGSGVVFELRFPVAR